MSDGIRVALLAERDVAAGADLFAQAFDRDGMARLVTPDAVERRAFLLRGGRKQIERAMVYRHVFGAYEGDALRGIAVWLPPGVAVRSTGAPPLGALPRLARLLVGKGPTAVHYLRTSAASKAVRQPPTGPTTGTYPRMGPDTCSNDGSGPTGSSTRPASPQASTWPYISSPN